MIRLPIFIVFGLIGLFVLAFTTNVILLPVRAEQQLTLVYPKPSPVQDFQTTQAEKIFFIGSAPRSGKVFINDKPITRNSSGHFAPSLPLQLGDNLFTVRYQNQVKQIKVVRNPIFPAPPTDVTFLKNSLTPNVDIARLPGEEICFSAIATPNATVTVRLGNKTIALLPQATQIQLPVNQGVLTGNNQPITVPTPGLYQGCITLETPGNWGKPQFELTHKGQTIKQEGTGTIQTLTPGKLYVAEVIGIPTPGAVRSGPSSDNSRLTPLPKGTRSSITGKEGEWLRLDYGLGNGAWIDRKETQVLPPATPTRTIVRSISSRQVPGATEIIFPLQIPVPLSVQQSDKSFSLTLYNTTAQTDTFRLDDNDLISRLDWQQVSPGQVQYTFDFKKEQQWGYKLRYEGTSLVLSLRNTPIKTDKGWFSKPLSGKKIVLDPGHGGSEVNALGPTGVPEKEVNLFLSKLLRDELVNRGATVVMTRDEDKDLSLLERVTIINKEEPTIAISIHYNALPDDGDAINTKGIGTFWYHPQAHSFAVFIHNYLVKKLNRPSYGVYWNNLALTRPTVAPSVLLELGFIINPYEFDWIINSQERQKLASTLASGIVDWFGQQSQ